MTSARTPNEMTVFVRAVEREGFSAAARDLALTPSAVSKIISRIENRVGVRLLNRTTRRLMLTEEGQAYFDHCRRILAEIEQAELELSRRRETPSGVLRVNCGLAFGQVELVGALPEFLARYSEIRVELRLGDELINLMDEGVDLVIRLGASPDSSLVGRKICDLERVIAASPEYLAKYGTPRAPTELLRHNCITVSTAAALRRWPFMTADGPVTIEVNGNLAANNVTAILDLALQGVGIARLTDLVMNRAIREGRLVKLFAESHNAEPAPLYALFPQGRHRSPKLVAMLNFLLEKFSHSPWRTASAPAQGKRKR